MDLGIELFADAADLVLGDALDAERLGEVVDRPRRDAMDVGLLDHRQQRTLVPAARLQEAWEVGALAELGDLQLQGADAGIPLPVSIAVAIGGPARRALVWLGPDEVSHFGVHQLLREQPHAVTQEVGIRALLRLVEQVQQCHPETRHRRGPPCGGLKQLHLDHTVALLSKRLWIYTTTRDTTHPGRLNSAPQTVLKTAGLASTTARQRPLEFDR